MELPIAHRGLWAGEIGATFAEPKRDGPGIVVEIEYLDPLGKRFVLRFPFSEVQRAPNEHTLLTRVYLPIPQLVAGDRARTVRLQLRAMTCDSDLPDWDLRLEGHRCRITFLDDALDRIEIHVGTNEPAEQIASRLFERLWKHHQKALTRGEAPSSGDAR